MGGRHSQGEGCSHAAATLQLVQAHSAQFCCAWVAAVRLQSTQRKRLLQKPRPLVRKASSRLQVLISQRSMKQALVSQRSFRANMQEDVTD